MGAKNAFTWTVLFGPIGGLVGAFVKDPSEDPVCDADPDTGHSLSLDQARQLLGVLAASSPKEIREAYRLKVSQWHPDKLESMAPELKTLATKQLQLINSAYELLQPKGRG